jgi:choline dehydrogenase-like flavoprotein
MILNLNQLPDDSQLAADLCIVGSGAAGLAIAREFLDGPLNVIVLESGGWELEEPTQQLYESAITGFPFQGNLSGRFRVLGGSTTRWGGQALPLFPIDFERREWVPHSGWPFGHEALDPFYRRAQEFMFLEPLNFDSDVLEMFRLRAVEFDPAIAHYHFSKFNRTPNLRQVYAPAIQRSSNVKLILHANVVGIELNDAGNHVRQIAVRSLEGRAARVTARAYVCCAGAIETARLLLAGDPARRPAGIANGNDLVGRFFMDHMVTAVATVRTADMKRLQRQFYQYHRHGTKYFPRVSASPEFQRHHRVLNMCAMFGFDASPESRYEALKQCYHLVRQRKLGRELLRKAAYCLANPFEIFAPIYQYGVHHRSYVPNALARLVILCEQEPSPDSRIRLSDQADALGMPRSDIHWKPTPLTGRSMAIFAKALKAEFERLNLGEVTLEEWLTGDGSGWEPNVFDFRHHMGTTRMSIDPSEGVVDPDCRTHEVKNLFIGGSAVFPTGGHSNPTLTLIALCLRLAERLKKELA